MKRILLLNFLFFVCVVYSATAQRTVSGTVTDEQGEVIPGVNVVLKGTANGTTTDLDGNYRVSIPEEGGILVFSFIGLASQEVVVGSRSVINIEMDSDVQQLTEVVVTGVGQAMDKRKVAIAVESVSADEIEEVAPSSDLSQALVGKVPGALISSVSGQPGTQQSILLRGINSLGGTQPMILVDGIQINTDNNQNGSASNLSSRLADLDLTNIERVEIVQGAAAATIYGAQGANGVIQIFTKTGSKGAAKVSFGSSYAMNNALTNGFKLADHHRFTTLESGAMADGNGDPLAPDAVNGIWPTPVGAVDGTTTIDNPFFEETFNNIEALLKDNVTTTNHYLNVSGGSDQLTYMASASYLDQESIMFGELNRLSTRLNLEAKILDNLKLTSRTNYIVSENTTGGITGQNNVNSGWSNAINTPQYIDLTAKDSRGQFVANPAGDNSINPFYTFNIRSYSAIVNRIIQNFQLDYELNRIIRFDTKFGFDRYLYDYTDFIQNQDDRLGSEFLGSIRGGTLERQFDRGMTLNSITSAYFNVNFEDDLGINLPIDWSSQVAFDFRKNTLGQTESSGTGLPSFTNDVTLSQAANYDIDEYEEIFVTYGYLFNTKFDYDGKFGVSGGFRTDFSSAFGEGSKPFTFPRADAYFRFSEFDFWSPLKSTLTEFKLRAAYGQAGVQPGAFDRIATLNPVSIDQTGSLNVQSTLNNPALGIQVSTEIEMGSDLTIALPGQTIFPYIMIGFTYWDRESADVIRAISVPPSTGSAQFLTNSLTFESDGIQASLTTSVVESTNFDWSTTVNLSQSKTVVADISNDLDIPLGNNFVIREGEVLGSIFGFEPLTSLDQTDSEGNRYIAEADLSDYEVGPRGYVVNVNNKAVQYATEQTVIGDPTPDFNISFINDFKFFKNLNFGFQLDWVQGFDIYNQTKQWLYRDLVHDDVDDAVSIGGESAAWANYYQSMYKTNDKTSAFIEDGSFVRLRNIYLSYDFAKLMKGVDRLKLTVSGGNLLTWTSYTGMDPEANSAINSAVTRGLDQFAFPNFKTVSVKLDVTL